MRGCTPGFIADRLMDAMHAVVVRVVTTGTGKSRVFKDPNHQIILKAVELAVRFQSAISGHHGNKSRAEGRDAALPADHKNLPKDDSGAAEDSSFESLHLSASEKVKTVLQLIAKDESLTPAELRQMILRMLDGGDHANGVSSDNT